MDLKNFGHEAWIFRERPLAVNFGGVCLQTHWLCLCFWFCWLSVWSALKKSSTLSASPWLPFLPFFVLLNFCHPFRLFSDVCTTLEKVGQTSGFCSFRFLVFSGIYISSHVQQGFMKKMWQAPYKDFNHKIKP